MLLQAVEKSLDYNGYDYLRYSGCFDIAAKREDLVLLKVTANIDSLSRGRSESLKALSTTLNAKAAVIGDHTNRETLHDGILYERFDLPVITPKTLDGMLSGGFPSRYRKRGGFFVRIDKMELKKARLEKGITQSQLADHIGVTKKSIYEHENYNKKMRLEHAKRLENFLGVKISLPAEVRKHYSTSIEPQSPFERTVIESLEGMGFSADPVCRSPFNIVAQDKSMLILSEAEEDMECVERKIPYMMKFSSLIDVPAIAVTKEEADLEIPTVKEEDLRYLKKRDIKRMIR